MFSQRKFCPENTQALSQTGLSTSTFTHPGAPKPCSCRSSRMYTGRSGSNRAHLTFAETADSIPHPFSMARSQVIFLGLHEMVSFIQRTARSDGYKAIFVQFFLQLQASSGTDKLIVKSLSVLRNPNIPNELLADASARDRIIFLFELISHGRQASKSTLYGRRK